MVGLVERKDTPEMTAWLRLLAVGPVSPYKGEQILGYGLKTRIALQKLLIRGRVRLNDKLKVERKETADTSS